MTYTWPETRWCWMTQLPSSVLCHCHAHVRTNYALYIEITCSISQSIATLLELLDWERDTHKAAARSLRFAEVAALLRCAARWRMMRQGGGRWCGFRLYFCRATCTKDDNLCIFRNETNIKSSSGPILKLLPWRNMKCS